MVSASKLGSGHFWIDELNSGVFAAIARDGGAAISNAGIIDLGDETLIFDTLMTPQAATALRETAKELTGRLATIVINSRYHNDHIWGNQVFSREATIISSTRTRELIQTEGMTEYEWYRDNSAQQLEALRRQDGDPEEPGGSRDHDIWIGYFEGLVEALPELEIHPPVITFEERLTIHGKDREAQLIAFKNGHTESDAVLHLQGDGVLFMSDLLFVESHPYLPEGDPGRMVEILASIEDLKCATLVPGHGPVGSPEDVRAMIEYIAKCRELVQGVPQDDRDAGETIGQIEIPAAYKGWRYARFFSSNLRFLFELELKGARNSD